MLSEKEVGLLYETLLSTPGMNDVVKLDLRISRKGVLLLVNVIQKGLLVEAGDPLALLLKAAGNDSKQGLDQVSLELLEKAGLSEMNKKLTSLHTTGK
ncbi:MAG TPA: hypothetical protein PK682_11095 [Niabella sp.]|jgi:hypothetical protein|nr:hypothetical protein [Niabella sp.]HQX21443.1 hypothetical protein [Niabella sp.]HQX73478.1 hypothetical protein [Chitinophagaceae bacterium]HRB36115.1 hypothetical protein [Niabella sp.]HRB72814.1 hypothetical protein [Flavobacterium sp.]